MTKKRDYVKKAIFRQIGIVILIGLIALATSSIKFYILKPHMCLITNFLKYSPISLILSSIIIYMFSYFLCLLIRWIIDKEKFSFDRDNIDNNSDVLQTQLSEINTRSRTYASQVWQIPLAYLTLAGFVLSEIHEKWKERLWVGFLVSGFIGIAVFFHMIGMLKSTKRAVDHIQRIEKELGLAVTALYVPGLNVYPLMAIVAIVAIACIMLA